ncbi:MAG: glycine/betaine ABC transporter substrate-binding protein, partial [Calditrichaeota bacterium]|nr:glycine/betaine ABC transporter substrate-binding protein [Calditrichota bacterium]
MRLFSKHIAFLNFLFLLIFTPANAQEIVTIGSKNFPESRVLGEVMAQLIEAKTDYAVQRKWGLGGTLISFEALRNGDIDIYPEYTGTGATAILNAPSLSANPDSLFAFVQREFRQQFQIEWLAPFGFNNT